jgi:hypothetical protein
MFIMFNVIKFINVEKFKIDIEMSGDGNTEQKQYLDFILFFSGVLIL